MPDIVRQILLISDSVTAGETLIPGTGIQVADGVATYPSGDGEEVDGIVYGSSEEGATIAEGETVTIVELGLFPVKMDVSSGITAGDGLSVKGTTGKFYKAAGSSGAAIQVRARTTPTAPGDNVGAYINTLEIPAEA
jgi:hypothetical protein